MYLIEPVYFGDISPESEYENGTIKNLVYLLDDFWDGDLLIAGTDIFLIGGELAEIVTKKFGRGITLRDAEIIYRNEKYLPDFKQMQIDNILDVRGNYYFSDDTADIFLTGSVGQLAVSDELFEEIVRFNKTERMNPTEIFEKSPGGNNDENNYTIKFVVLTPCSSPFDLIPREVRKTAKYENETFYIDLPGTVAVSAPYLKLLADFDIGIHGYTGIYELYFLLIRGNDINSVMNVIAKMSTRGFYIGRSLKEKLVMNYDFIEKYRHDNNL